MAQIAILNQALRLHSEGEQNIEISGNRAIGSVKLAWGDDSDWVIYEFLADIKTCKGEISEVNNLEIRFVDADIEPLKTYQASDFAHIEDAASIIIESFIYDYELEHDEPYQYCDPYHEVGMRWSDFI